MPLKEILNNYFPSTVRLILIKALLFFMFYKFLFSLELKTVHYPLTSHVGKYTTILLNTFVDAPYFSVNTEFVKGQTTPSSQIYFKNKKIVFIADSCNGLIAFMRYLSFIFCFPSGIKRKLFYVILGAIIIHILNIIRCAALAYINLYHQSYFSVAHDHWFKYVMYGAILILWILFLRKVHLQNKLETQKTSLI